MIQNELQPEFYQGLTRQEVIDRIIDFELEHDIMPDWREVLEYGFGGYHYLDDEVLKELYIEYFTDEEREGDPDQKPNEYLMYDFDGNLVDAGYPEDYVPMDGHGNTIGDKQ